MNHDRKIIPLVLITALLALVAPAGAATIKTIALQNQPSPQPFLLYRRFERPAVSDAVGERVAVFALLRGGKCIFGIDPNTTTIRDLTGRPQYLVDHAQPMRELV